MSEFLFSTHVFLFNLINFEPLQDYFECNLFERPVLISGLQYVLC